MINKCPEMMRKDEKVSRRLASCKFQQKTNLKLNKDGLFVKKMIKAG